MKKHLITTKACSGNNRQGKVLILMAILMPTLFGILGLVIDSSLLMHEYRSLQQVTDAAATTAALELSRGESLAVAKARATEIVQTHNNLSDATLTVNVGPTSGLYVGQSNYVEVIVNRQSPTYFIQVIRGESIQNVTTRAVAGIENATSEAAMVVLDPDPPGITVGGIPLSVTIYPSIHLGGLESLGLGRLKVEGSVHVNTEWGGKDEEGLPVGDPMFLRSSVTCTPLLPLTKVLSEDLRVVGGVDNPNNYGHLDSSSDCPLQANRRPVPDPLIDLPAPSAAVDPDNVSSVNRGSVNVINLPILAPPVVLRPGVYNYINVIAGPVRFEPGVYIVRGVNPLTQIAVSILAGPVTAEGVMFYITDSGGYSTDNGSPDSGDGETVPPDYSVTTLLPSVVINAGLLGSKYTPLNDPGSPFDGMLLYQRRTDRRPIVLVAEQLIGSTNLSGMIYSKWGHLIFAGHGTYDLALCAGSIRVVNVLECKFNPTRKFLPAKDVFLVD